MSAPVRRAVDPSLVPEFGLQSGLNPTGTGYVLTFPLFRRHKFADLAVLRCAVIVMVSPVLMARQLKFLALALPLGISSSR